MKYGLWEAFRRERHSKPDEWTVAKCPSREEEDLCDEENDIPDGEDIFTAKMTAENAKLIAAAPELLDQLKRLVNIYEQLRPKISLKDGYPDPAALIENLDHMIPYFKAAIAKAEGEKKS